MLPPLAVAWLRIVMAALIIAVIVRPRISSYVGLPGLIAAGYGGITLMMNVTFYNSIATIPMGTAVAIEFLGPVVIAARGVRGIRDVIALALAFVGVIAITGATGTKSLIGLLWAAGAAASFALYILITERLAALDRRVTTPRRPAVPNAVGSRRPSALYSLFGPRRESSLTAQAMSVGFIYASILGLPLAWWYWPADVSPLNPAVIGYAIILGVFGTTIPYALDLMVIAKVDKSYFAFLQALLPLVATVIGLIGLRQWLSWPELIGIVLIVVGIAMKSSDV